MKHLLLLFLFSPLLIFAQRDSVIAYSPLVKLLMKPSTLVQIEYDTVGSTNDVVVSVITARSLKDSISKRSVCFSSNNIFSLNSRINERSLQIPVEELSVLIDALELIQKETEVAGIQNNQRYQYISSNYTVLDAERRFYNSKRWDIFLYTRYENVYAIVPGTSIAITQRNLAAFLNILQQLQQKLATDLYRQL